MATLNKPTASNSASTEMPEVVAKLVNRFGEQRDTYMSGGYNETQVRRDFIDPFFKALGWDIDNENGYAEAYRDVIHEDIVLVGNAKKAPDYSFRIGGTRKFFVEAKKPSVSISTDPKSSFQLRRYGWSAKLPLSVLTDFEELAVYDCTQTGRKAEREPSSVTLLQIHGLRQILGRDIRLIFEVCCDERKLRPLCRRQEERHDYR
jgi:hypothetical protein